MMAVDSVRRADDDLSVVLLPQLFGHRREVNDFRGTNKGEVSRIEEDDQILTFVVRKLTFGKLEVGCKNLHFKVRAGGA